MTHNFSFDLITIGGGSGGVALSRRAAAYGARVVICEDDQFGGTCVVRGCIPKKLLVYAGELGHSIALASSYGWQIHEANRPAFHWPELQAAVRKEVDRLSKIYVNMLQKSGVHILHGRGKILDPHTVQVGDKSFTAQTIAIATGSRPYLPGIEGIEHAWTSNEALRLEQLPKSVAIVGGGYIGVEFACIFRSLGVEVTQIIRRDHVLNGFDQDLREHLQELLRAQDIDLRSNTSVSCIRQQEDRSLELTLQDADSTTTTSNDYLQVDGVLFATGRKANLENLGIVELGIATTSSAAIKVNEWSQTSVPSIYAIGDVTDRVNLTPVAVAEGRALAETLYNSHPSLVVHEGVPNAVFSQPPLASVGLSEQQARKHYERIDIYQTSFRPLKLSLSDYNEKTLIKIVVDQKSDRVLGCHMIGPQAPEIIQSLAVALQAGATKSQFDATMAIHPTSAEEFVTLYQGSSRNST